MRIFQKVHCKAYLQKFYDGVFLETWKKTQVGSFGYCEEPEQGNKWDEPIIVKAVKQDYTSNGYKIHEIADLSAFEGETVSKEYRRRVEEDFDGFLVGVTYIVTKGEIGTDMTMYQYNMSGDLREVFHLTKNTHKEKVGVVYFKNNAKRYVLIDDIERREDGFDRQTGGD